MTGANTSEDEQAAELSDDAARATAAAAADRSRWRCMECDYSLAYSVEQRCPECGTPFSPAEMAAMYADRPLPSYPWEKANGRREWLRTCELVLWRNNEFVGRMSLVPDGEAALHFSAYTQFIAIAAAEICAIATALLLGGHAVVNVVANVVFGGVMIGLLWCVVCTTLEFVLVILFTATLRPRDRLNGNAVWRAIVHYHAAHAALTSVLFVLAVPVLAAGLQVTRASPEHTGLAALVVPVVGGVQLVLGIFWMINLLTSASALSRPSVWRQAVLAAAGAGMFAFVLASVAGLLLTIAAFASAVVGGRF